MFSTSFDALLSVRTDRRQAVKYIACCPHQRVCRMMWSPEGQRGWAQRKELSIIYVLPFSPQLYLFPHHKTTTKGDSHRQSSRDQDVVEPQERETSSHQNENQRRYSRLWVRRKKEGTIVLILISVLFLLRVSVQDVNRSLPVSFFRVLCTFCCTHEMDGRF